MAEVNTDPRYQWMPPMQAPDFRRLKESIAEHGFRPEFRVVLDDQGHIIDGHHRAMACAELGIECPTRVEFFASEQDKDDYVWIVNVPRRHMTTEEKRQLIRTRLKQRPEESNRRIADVVGVDDKTVGAIRTDLEACAEIPHIDQPKTPLRNRATYQTDDGADHRRMCWVEITIGYPASEGRERAHGSLPYEKSERMEWPSYRMWVTAPSPKTRGEAAVLLAEACGIAVRERMVDRPLMSMPQHG